jgi:hypothetical protein
MQDRWIIGKTIASVRRERQQTDYGVTINAITVIVFTDGSSLGLVGQELPADICVQPVYSPKGKQYEHPS